MTVMKYPFITCAFIGSLMMASSMIPAYAAPGNAPHMATTQMHHGKHFRHFDRKITEQDARTLAQAGLIRRGQKNLQVGKIITKERKGHKRYIINITTKKGTVVRKMLMNGRTGKVRPIPMT